MKELLYLEIPTPDQAGVVRWLHQVPLNPDLNPRIATPNGFRLEDKDHTLVVCTWWLQNTTYLKVFQWSEQEFPQQLQWLQSLEQAIRIQFPHHYPALPPIEKDLLHQSIFEALDPYYPLTVKYFRRIPNGEFDLQRVYWWEKRWREEVKHGRRQATPLCKTDPPESKTVQAGWDIVVVGGALGAIYAATMAQLGYRVALIERLPFGRMNREWNISRREIQTLVDIRLFTPAEVESLIVREYEDGFNKFFDGNSPVKAPILHTPTVLNLAIDAERLLTLCGGKIKAANGDIFERTEFQRAYINPDHVTVEVKDLATETIDYLQTRLLVDAMGTASPISQQLDQQQAFDSVCPTVGAVIKSGFAPGVWDSRFGDILASHGDISRGRQLIWELFPGPEQELTFYLFHYHEVHPDNPGSLLEMYEDFFQILPEYRRCDPDTLEWKKATFGYIPARFGRRMKDYSLEFDRVITIGDAAAMQSPLSFTGFGSLVRNLPRLADLLHTALKHNLLTAADLYRIQAYQANSAVTWLFSRGMMVPTGVTLPPARINTTLNSFFGILETEPPEVADDFIKDRATWTDFSRMALKAAWKEPRILLWTWQAVGFAGFLHWIPTYLGYTFSAFLSYLLNPWLKVIHHHLRSYLESFAPRLWHRILAWTYTLTYGNGLTKLQFQLPTLENIPAKEQSNVSSSEEVYTSTPIS